MMRDILDQYLSLKKETDRLKDQIKLTEKRLEEIQANGTVKDRVYGGEGGLQGFNIEGFPIAEFENYVDMLKAKKTRLITQENLLLELENDAERFVSSIPNSRDRNVFRMIYFDGMTQEEVGDKLHFDRSMISKIISKYV